MYDNERITERKSHMSKMQAARELYKIRNGCRTAVVNALVLDHEMTWCGARTYYQVVATEVHNANYRRKHRWDFLKDPQTYFTPLLVLAIIILAR